MVELAVKKHVLLPGEHLINVLRTTFNVPDHLIFNEHLNLIKEINPDLTDLNSLGDDTTLLIPLGLPPKGLHCRIVIKETVEATTTTSATEQKKQYLLTQNITMFYP